jgi:hypothetical protein
VNAEGTPAATTIEDALLNVIWDGYTSGHGFNLNLEILTHAKHYSCGQSTDPQEPCANNRFMHGISDSCRY